MVNPQTGVLDIIDASNPLAPAQVKDNGVPVVVDLVADCTAVLGAACPVVGGSEPVADVDAIVADLDSVDAAALAAAGPPTLGFYSHVDVDTRKAALEAGVDVVVPRSRMARELPEFVERLLET